MLSTLWEPPAHPIPSPPLSRRRVQHSRGIAGMSRQGDLPSLKCLLGGFLLQHPSLLLPVPACRCGIRDVGCLGWSLPAVCAAPPERPAKPSETSWRIEIKSPGITSWQQVRMAVEEGRQPKLISWSEGCSNPSSSSTASGEPGVFQRWGEANPLSPGLQPQWGLPCPLLGSQLPCELSQGLKCCILGCSPALNPVAWGLLFAEQQVCKQLCVA